MARKITLGALLVVLGVAGVVGYLIYMGAFSSRDGALKGDLCAEHGVAEPDCPWCKPELIESLGECAEHRVPEALCWLCTPALIEGYRAEYDWCEGHDLPESRCIACNPDLLESSPAEDESDAPVSSEIVRDPDLPRSQRLPSVTCETSQLRVQFTSAATPRRAGFEYAPVESREIAETTFAYIELTHDKNHHTCLAARAPGIIHEIRAALGQRVEKGDVLALIDSVALGDAKAAYLQAVALVALHEKNYTRELRLAERRVGVERELYEAETKLAESRIALSRSIQRLRTLGLEEEQISAVKEKNDISSLLPLIAPFPGTVIERSASLGEVVDTTTRLITIADTSRVWAMLDIREKDLVKTKPGQAVVLEIEGLRGEQYGGHIDWISSQIDQRTRTIVARAVIPNPTGLLRAGMFGRARVRVSEKKAALVVPREAVQWEGCCNIVFVKRSDIFFEPRKVRLGLESEHFTVVEKGVVEGDFVVTTGSFVLKTEILKGSIGAGCCEVNPGAN